MDLCVRRVKLSRLAGEGEISVHQCRMETLQESKIETGQASIRSKCKQVDSERLRLEDSRISIALMSSFVVLTAQYFVLVSGNLMGTAMGHNIKILSKILVGALFAYALPIVLKRNKKRFIGTYTVWTFVFLLHYLMFPENNTYEQELVFPLFAMCLPAFIYSSTIHDWAVLRNVMSKASYIVFCVGLLLGVMVFWGKASVGSYSMSLSYYLLLPSVMFIDEFLDRPRLRNIMFALLSILLILAIGARGPIMCIAVFIILKLIRSPERLRFSHVCAYLFSIFLVIIVVLFFDELLMSIYNLLSRFGIRSRSILLFLQPELHLSGRDRVYSRVIAEIMDNPITGIGIGGDRRVIGGGYAHNLFIELIADYGVLLGTLFVLALLVLMIRFFLSRNRYQYDMFAIWLSIGVIPLLVSSSYIEDMRFWIFLGLASRTVTIKYRK